MESDHKLRHLPFFEDLAVREEGTDEWHASTAGLVVLRLVDTWLENGGPLAPDDNWSVRSVRCAIEAMNEGTPIRTILGRVVDGLELQKPDIHVVVTPLMAYGRALEYEAKWPMAADVYHSVLAHVHPSEDSDTSIAAHLRLGQCYRNLNRIDDAAAAFAAASELATAAADMVGVLRARVGEARIAMLRGNLPKAEEILEDTIRRAEGPELLDVRSRALHDRANVAHFRKQYELAIRFAYQALADSQSSTERDRVLSDIAVSFLELGVFSAARDAYLVLSSTAQEQYMRWAATLNLLEISSQTGAEMLFEMYRRQLVNQELPPYLATAFELNVGLGYHRFGNTDRARHHLERAMLSAGEHGLNQYFFEAEEALLQLEATTPPRRVSAEASLDVQEVALAIRELRESVGAG